MVKLGSIKLSLFFCLIMSLFACSEGSLEGNVSPSGSEAGLLQSGAEGPSFDLYIGVSESTNNRSYLKRLLFNSDSNTVTDSSYLQMSYNSEFRGMGLDADGNIFVANAMGSIPLEVVDLSNPASPSILGDIDLDHSSNATVDPTLYHTTCALPNGNLIVGGYNPGNTVYLNEYTPDGELIQNVYSSPHVSFNISMNKCVSRSNLEIFFLDAASNVGGGAKLVRVARSSLNATWTVQDELLDSDMDTVLGTSGSSFWSLAVDPENGYVYVGRYMDTGTQMKKIIRCPITGFHTGNCSAFGDDVPGDSRIKSMIVIPGSGDLLVFAFVPNDTLYRLDADDGTWTSLYDLTTMDLGSDSYGQPWAKAILK